jgi:drug/metabolite transporter (DMT)-like permease
MTADRPTLLAFIGVVLLGGVSAIGVKQTVIELEPFWGAASRFAAAGLILAAIVIVTGRAIPRGRSLAGAVLYGAVGFAASNGFAHVGFRDAPAGTAAAIAHRQEPFRAQGLIGAVVALAGIAIVFADQISADVPVLSLALILLGALCIAETGVIVKWIPRADPFATNGVAMLTGAAILLALSMVAAEPWRLPTQAATWASVGYLVIFGSVVMFGLYLFALERWTASAVSYITLLLPLVTVSLAALLLGERISPSFVVGGAVILVGVYVGAFLKIRPRRSSASSLPECLPIDACAPQEVRG